MTSEPSPAETPRAGDASPSQEAFLTSNLFERPFPLIRGRPTTFGREPGNVVWLSAKPVSRYHAVIRWADGFTLYDPTSMNGTFVNGERVRVRVLRDGDVVRIDQSDFVFHCEGSLSSETSIIDAVHSGAFSGEIVANLLFEVWQMIELNRKTGELVTRSGRREGRVFFANGMALHATWNESTGTEAALDILGLGAGSFQFLGRDRIDAPRTISVSSGSLLLEAARRADERRGIGPTSETSRFDVATSTLPLPS